MSEKDITPATKTRTRKPATKKATKVKEKDVVQNDVFEQTEKQLPALTSAKGESVALTVSNIHTFGMDAGASISVLNDQILNRVKVADSGEFGESVNNILALTRSVDIESLGTPQKGVWGKVMSLFRDAKRQVTDQLNTSYDQIQEIVKTLDGGVVRMEDEGRWLESVYTANIDHLKELKTALASIEEVKAPQEEILNTMRQDDSIEVEKFEEQKLIVEALDKQADKVRRLITLSQLMAPQIMSMRKVNTNTHEKYQTLITTTIPAWKTQMSLGLISDAQRKDNELGAKIDDQTNLLLSNNADTVAKNMVDSAKANQRGVVDLDTLRKVQNTMLKGINDTIMVEQSGAAEREKAKLEMEKMNQDLKNSLLEIADKTHKK
jgi:Uncharacterized protein involved in tellurite resistance